MVDFDNFSAVLIDFVETFWILTTNLDLFFDKAPFCRFNKAQLVDFASVRSKK